MPMLESFRVIDAEFPWFFAVVVFVFGACWGSFLNVVIYRVPLKKSVVTPRSFCTTSGKPIPWYDNIPLLSWVLLGGKSRFDKKPISIRYPAVELLTALLFLAVWLLQPHEIALPGFVFLALLISGTFIDLEHMILPDFATVGGMLAGVLFSCFIPAMQGFGDAGQPYFIEGIRAGIMSVIGVLVGSAVILWIAVLAETLLKREAMGFGDVLFMGCIGAFCGWKGALFAIFGGALFGTIVVIPLMVIQKIFGLKAAGVGRVENRTMEEVAASEEKGETKAGEDADQNLKMGTAIPFGPWLAVGGMLYYVFLRAQVDAYFANLQDIFYVQF